MVLRSRTERAVAEGDGSQACPERKGVQAVAIEGEKVEEAS
jgi:hypothetical protein